MFEMPDVFESLSVRLQLTDCRIAEASCIQRVGNPLYNPFPCHYLDLIFPRFTNLVAQSMLQEGFLGGGHINVAQF